MDLFVYELSFVINQINNIFRHLSSKNIFSKYRIMVIGICDCDSHATVVCVGPTAPIAADNSQLV